MTLSDTDFQLYQNLRKAGVLEEIEPHRLEINDGIILVSCSDGDQFPDIVRHMGDVLVTCGAKRRIHPFTDNGGPLILDPSSPLASNMRCENLLVSIDGARELKGIATVALCTHAPCGMARKIGLNLAEVIRSLKQGKAKLERSHSGLVVRPFVQIDLPDQRKRTYFISGQRWRRWSEARGYAEATQLTI